MSSRMATSSSVSFTNPAVNGPENGGVPRLQAFRPRCRRVHEDHGYQVFSVIAPKRVPTP